MTDKARYAAPQAVESGKYVTFKYSLYDDKTGNLLFRTPDNAPDVMIAGMTEGFVPGLLAAMEGLHAGDRFQTILPPEAAFGPRIEENVDWLPKDIFMRDGKLAPGVKVGAELPMMTQTGIVIKGRVLEIADHKVRMDFNHPFAGLTVRYEGEVEEVRDPTPEELHPAKGCGGCGGGCGSGGCESGSCESGCGGCH